MARAAFGGQWPAFQAGSPAHGCTAIHGACSLGGEWPALQAGSGAPLQASMARVAFGVKGLPSL